MKKFPIAAVALLFGTSAYAMVPSTEPTGVQVDKNPYVVTGATALDAATDSAKLQPAAVDWWGASEPVAFTPAAYASDEANAADAGALDDKAATDETELEAAVADVEPAAYETSAVDEAPLPVEKGVGGPDDVELAAAAPRPAAQNYPACRPGRGDDNCIQLYEAGVREQLASWNQPTGGFAGAGETRVAMGGPYEPADSATETERLNQQALAASTSATQVAMGGPYEAVDEAVLTHEAAMSGDGSVDTAMGETGEDEDLAEV